MKEEMKTEIAELVLAGLSKEIANIMNFWHTQSLEVVIESQLNRALNTYVKEILEKHEREYGEIVKNAIKDKLATMEDREFKHLVYRALIEFK